MNRFFVLACLVLSFSFNSFGFGQLNGEVYYSNVGCSYEHSGDVNIWDRESGKFIPISSRSYTRSKLKSISERATDLEPGYGIDRKTEVYFSFEENRILTFDTIVTSPLTIMHFQSRVSFLDNGSAQMFKKSIETADTSSYEIYYLNNCDAVVFGDIATGEIRLAPDLF